MEILHESDIHDALPTIGICEHNNKEYLYVWYDTVKRYGYRIYIYTPLISRALLQEQDMYTIYRNAIVCYTGTWENMTQLDTITDDMLPMPGEYYNEGEANTS